MFVHSQCSLVNVFTPSDNLIRFEFNKIFQMLHCLFYFFFFFSFSFKYNICSEKEEPLIWAYVIVGWEPRPYTPHLRLALVTFLINFESIGNVQYKNLSFFTSLEVFPVFVILIDSPLCYLSIYWHRANRPAAFSRRIQTQELNPVKFVYILLVVS